jgi:hypothetical protein
MSKISTIHDYLVTLVSTQLPSYTELPNPYIPEENNELYLSKGFGVAVGAGQDRNRVVSCKLTWQRDFQVVLTNQITATDHDITQRQTVTKAILEDHYTLIDAIYKDTGLGGNAAKAEVFADSGLQFLTVGETDRYFVIILDVLVEYFEDLT